MTFKDIINKIRENCVCDKIKCLFTLILFQNFSKNRDLVTKLKLPKKELMKKKLYQKRSCHQRCSVKKVFLESCKIHRKTRLEACNFITKEILAQVFSCEFCKISKKTFYYRTSLVAASVKAKVVLTMSLKIVTFALRGKKKFSKVFRNPTYSLKLNITLALKLRAQKPTPKIIETNKFLRHFLTS